VLPDSALDFRSHFWLVKILVCFWLCWPVRSLDSCGDFCSLPRSTCGFAPARSMPLPNSLSGLSAWNAPQLLPPTLTGVLRFSAISVRYRPSVRLSCAEALSSLICLDQTPFITGSDLSVSLVLQQACVSFVSYAEGVNSLIAAVHRFHFPDWLWIVAG
jgi:hypothetical protein